MLVEELEKLKVSILRIAETHLKKECVDAVCGEDLFFHTPHPSLASQGVRFLVSMSVQDSIKDVIKVSSRIMAIKLARQKRELLLVQVYAPDSSYPDEEYENFCQQIQTILPTTHQVPH